MVGYRMSKCGCASRVFSDVQKNPEKTMKPTMVSTISHAIITIAMALTVSQTTVIGQDRAPERSLAGVWLVKVTPRNCATGEPILPAAFESLFTFHEDKTMSVSFRNNTLALERTPAHGLWRPDFGWSEYSFKFVHIRRNVSTGAFAGLQESAGTLVLASSGDEFTTDGSTTVLDVNGNPVGAPGCANSVGTRFNLER